MTPLLIAVVHWNSREETLGCLGSLLGAADAGHQILLLDSASANDDCAEFQALHPRIRCLRLTDNRGYAAALNLAREQCLLADFAGMLMLNSDTRLEPETVSQLLQAHARHTDAVLACLVLDAAGTAVAMPEKFLHADRRWRSGRRDRSMALPVALDTALPLIAAAHGAAWFVPRSILHDACLDEQFFLYCEETDFCLRLGRRGVLTYLVPNARVRHRGGDQGGHGQPVQHMLHYYRTRNEIELWRRHGGLWWYWIAGRKTAKALLALLLARRGASYLTRGCVDGWRGRLGKRFAPESVWRQP